MAIWDEDGLITGRVVALDQLVAGAISEEDIGPLDEEDRAYIEGAKKQIEELKAMGIENPYFSIPQM